MEPSKRFIAMCKEAEECKPFRLEKGKRYYHPDQGVFIYGQKPGKGNFDSALFLQNVDTTPGESALLPNVNLIKAMLTGHGLSHLIESFNKITTDFHDYFEDFESDEEKWLAYYMWLKNKKWSKEDYTWVDKK